MAEEPVWLQELRERVECPTCGCRFGQAGFRVTGQRSDGHWIVRCTCAVCGSEFVVAVLVSDPHRHAPSSRPPLTQDDVLSAHDILADYAGDVHGLIGASRSHERRG